MSDLYCPMIHGGLEINFKDPIPKAQHCCLRSSRFPIDIGTDYWNNRNFISLREKNKQNIWASGCENCKILEEGKSVSFRVGMTQGLHATGYDLSGPSRIDLTADINCNLGCRTCGPNSSTFWQKHLKENGAWKTSVESPQHYDKVILALSQLDLSNLKILVFCGGETLLGHTYWKIANWLADNVPHAKQQLTLCFQTNGTQPIPPRYYELIDRFFLVKLHFSLDGIGKRFEYLRWPADWNQVIDNISQIQNMAPTNTMFVVEETLSVFNLWYTNELSQWLNKNFLSNREGDITNHTQHLAHGIFSLKACSQEYIAAIDKLPQYKHMTQYLFQENPELIKPMIAEIKKFDTIRNQDWTKIFPEVAEFYARFL